MKRRGFLINTTALVLLIPLLLLVATYESVSYSILGNQAELMQSERTFRIVSYLEEDFENVLQLSAKRALALTVDFVVSEQPVDNASRAISTLIMEGDYPYFRAGAISGKDWEPTIEEFMGNNTIKDWINNMKIELRKQGYYIETPTEEVLRNTNIIVGQLDSFHVVVMANISQIKIVDGSNNVVYEGPLPRKGSAHAILSVEGTEDPLFPVLSNHRLSRIVYSCEYAFPELTPPYTMIEGDAINPTTLSRFSAPMFSSPRTGSIYYYDTYLEQENVLGYVIGRECPASVNAPALCNTTVAGVPVSPRDVVNSGDMGVMVLESSGSGGAGVWCNTLMESRVNFTLPANPNTLTLLVFTNPPFKDAAHSGNKASIRIYKRDTCELVPCWIEYWGDDKILIWLNTTDTSEYSVYYTTDPSYVSWGNIGIFPYYRSAFSLPAGEKQESFLTNLSWSTVYVRYQLRASQGTTPFNGGVGVSWDSMLSGGDLVVNVSYPHWLYYPSLDNVQIPVQLNSTIAQMIDHDSNNRARIQVYDIAGNPLPFWVEYWNDTGALIWVKAELVWDLLAAKYKTAFRISYNTGPYVRGDGDAVFPFFDDFNETLSKWDIDPYNQGAQVIPDASNSVVELVGGSSLFSMRNMDPLNIYYDFAVRFRMKPTFSNARDWDAGVAVWDGSLWGRPYGWRRYLQEQLFTDDMKNDDNLAIHWAGWRQQRNGGWTLSTWWARNDVIDEYRGDSQFHTYEVREFFEGSVSFLDLTKGRVNIYDLFPVSISQPLNYIYLVIDSGNANRGALFDWVFVRRLLPNEDELTVNIQWESSTQGEKLEFVDSGTGAIRILRNWTQILNETLVLSDVSVPQRYQVTVSGGSVSFTHEPNTNPTTLASVVTNRRPVSLWAVVDNAMNNTALFDWIVAFPAYSETSVNVLTAPESKPQGGVLSKKDRVYDVQPFITCVEDGKYFGVDGAPSFLERLEHLDPGTGRSANWEYYERLSAKLQRRIYGEVKYPIGLVSFILPKNLPPNIAFIVRKRPAADFIYLDYKNLPTDDPNAKKVLGISANGGVNSMIIDENFYLDWRTAEMVFVRRQVIEDLLWEG